MCSALIGCGGHSHTNFHLAFFLSSKFANEIYILLRHLKLKIKIQGYLLLPDDVKAQHNVYTMNISMSARNACFGNR
jgi:hypothetical protein